MSYCSNTAAAELHDVIHCSPVTAEVQVFGKSIDISVLISCCCMREVQAWHWGPPDTLLYFGLDAKSNLLACCYILLPAFAVKRCPGLPSTPLFVSGDWPAASANATVGAVMALNCSTNNTEGGGFTATCQNTAGLIGSWNVTGDGCRRKLTVAMLVSGFTSCSVSSSVPCRGGTASALSLSSQLKHVKHTPQKPGMQPCICRYCRCRRCCCCCSEEVSGLSNH
jgi:hypothetical protein